MKKNFKKISYGILFGVLLLGFSSEGMGADKKLLQIAACPSASTFYTYHVAVSQLVNKKIPEVSVSVLETGGAVDNLRRITKGEADWGQFAEPDFYEFYQGVGPWQGKPHSHMRLYWLVNPFAYLFVVTKASGVKTLQDLEGKSFCPGPRGSATEKLMENMLKILGIKPNYFPAGLGDAVAAVKDRRIAGFVKAAPTNAPDGSVLDAASLMPINLITTTETEIKKIQAVYPYWEFMNIPAGLYSGVGEFTARAAFLAMGGSKTLDPDLVYKIVKTVCENVDYQASAYPAVKGTDFASLTVKRAHAPLHAGSVKYFRERGLKIPDRLIPPEMK